MHAQSCYHAWHALILDLMAAADVLLVPVTVLGELVHNETVLEDLRARGIRFCADIGGVETPREATPVRFPGTAVA